MVAPPGPTPTLFKSATAAAIVGYVPGIVRHHYHGTKANRKYQQSNLAQQQ